MDNKTLLKFSIVIPAHNEEKYIEETLKHLKEIGYPNDFYEVVVVENGSSDKTYEISKKYECENFKVFSIDKKGVSVARNFGAKKIKENSDWLIFLDADTHLKKGFLDDLNDFLIKNSSKNYVVGTTSLLPQKNSLYAKFWFKFYDISHILLHASLSIQIVRKDVFYKVWYDENLQYTEDWKMMKSAEKFGKFFFIWTNKVYTSTRRFDSVGYIKQLMLFIYWGILPERYKRKVNYEVIR
ncbi:glycosyltransferase family 2 protein [Caldisericum exile]|uniref:glycosyltransferase family 2 protein n=1 Tax=Caldisericum exile TaxID=693075 RepID=UPI003C75E4F7